jgi:GNAT superfamily N-acetyltransferase
MPGLNGPRRSASSISATAKQCRAGLSSEADQSNAATADGRENQLMQPPSAWSSKDGYEVSTDPARLDIDRIHRFLSGAYWSRGIPRDVVERGIANSLPFGLHAPSGKQIGFARAITDRATYAYLADVYVEVEHRGQGLGKLLVSCVLKHPELQGLRRWALATADAHGLYARLGFGPAASPQTHMFLERPAEELWPSS